jgi:phage terminase small subunit
MAGVRQKPRAELADQSRARMAVVEDVPATERLVVPMPEGLQAETQEIWHLHMDTAKHLGRSDFGHVLTWIHSWDDYFLVRKGLAAAADADRPWVSRLQSQKYGLTVHPLVRQMAVHRGEILRLEAALGFNPQARMRLGITFAAEQTALERLRGGGARKPPARLEAAS